MLRGVGGQIAQKLNRLGIYAIKDLLFHMPLRYVDRTRLCPIGALRSGFSMQVEGNIEFAQVRYGKRRSLLCRISDGTGVLTLRFFYFSRAQQERLQRGMKLRCYGQARYGAQTLEMVHPEYQVLASDQELPVDETLTPVYPATEGLQQPTLRKLTTQALAVLEHSQDELTELLPDAILEKFELPELGKAIAYVHRPPADAITQQLMDGIHPAQQRLAFEELLAQYLGLQRLRKQVRAHIATPLGGDGIQSASFLKALPFRLTAAQQRCAEEIKQDMQDTRPMLRLLQGDVGSGKTVIAALAAIKTIESGYQAAIMAPTELLAEQHYKTLKHWLQPMDVSIILLTGKLGKSERNKHLDILARNNPCIVIGTHALFQQDVVFSRLRLIIIDEQHRFGVHQRLALLDKGMVDDIFPHQLIMTATPIPRTLAMTIYADLDLSVIDELPPNRLPVNTVVISTVKRDEVIERIARACAEGRQVYWVCTLIEESEVLQCEAATDTSLYLAEKLHGINVGLIHGRLKPAEKDSIMSAFRSGEIQLLVATTVIEVGVDVPNASLMIIENAERLGLFQLHQLRGRIGRGSIKSDCVLLYQPPLGETAKIRLETLRNTNDGFEIAKKDLELRGPGEMMGTRQTGLPELRIADLIRDAGLLPDIHKAADILMQQYPELIQPLVDRWLGKDIDYSKV
ncbi:MAG: ATP-dependent DNA helicase RecG [Gammaproteobacteria bacterium RIFCSPLOWO2_02_47_7]|nr:MAG: ATP-dependent DNA helicase RecG [Gammaproteobacteria bacterium RIFCSPLOWO2_02_47_7]